MIINKAADGKWRIFSRSLAVGDYAFLLGEGLRARQIEHVLDKYSERTGTIKKSSHKIRKTYASNLNAAGVPLDEIRSQLGHTNLNTTM